ncbi:MAG: IgGFc-binding protein, partial [Prolixibacteraceae bacterium]|nr:IgGFc-binding protein [Prolixibacteraceae bacterium]
MRFIISICLILFAVQFVFAEEDLNKCHKSTEGTDFWFGFMENRWYHNATHYLEITVTARVATTFNITIGPNEDLFNGPYFVTDNGSLQIQIPWSMVEAMNSEETQSKGIHLVSDLPVNVYALNYDSNSADVAVIYPIESLGTEYYAMCYTPDVNIHSDGYAEGRNSEFLIVATEDSTVVSITPSVITDKNMPAGITFTETLDKGEVYQIQSANNDYPGQGDLTGSHISSNKPIAFYSGNLATIVPIAENMGGYDHLFEQIPPAQSWGREYYLVPLKTRDQDRYRVMASKNNTTINIQGVGNYILDEGEFKEFILDSNHPARLIADKPVLVAQFSQSKNSDNKNGDPFMIILSPASQSKNDVTFVTYDSEPITNFYVNIISLTSEIHNLELTGAYGNVSIQNQFFPFPNSEFSYARITIYNGTYRLRNTNPEKGFLAYVYGFGNYESYGYGVGFNLDLILDIGQSLDITEGDTLRTCYGDLITLDAGPYFDTYDWNIGEKNQQITFSTTESGKYWAHTTTNDGCYLEDTIYIKTNHPEIKNRINDDQGCYPYS